jgi:hypothetical protein
VSYRKPRCQFLCCCFPAAPPCAPSPQHRPASTPAGHEIHDGKPNGRFYLFSDKQVTVADPNSLQASSPIVHQPVDEGGLLEQESNLAIIAAQVLAIITTDHKGAGFEDSSGTALVWGDTTYMENPSAKRYLVFANAYSPQFQDQAFVYVFDTQTNKVSTGMHGS